MKWTSGRPEWTAFVLDVFDKFMQSKGYPQPKKNFMGVDAVWRDPSLGYITLTLEHENEGDLEAFLGGEIRD